MADLISISRTFDYHVIAISETWFRNDSVPNIDGYSLYRKDRLDGRRGGGVAIYITDVFNSHEVNQFYTNLLEQVWVSVKFNNKHILIGCIYRPNDASLIKYVAESFKLAHSLIKKPYDDCLIVGDFNFPNIKWSNDGIESFNPNNPTEYDFWNIFQNSLFTQHITFPTFQTDYGSSNNMLDLLFTYNSNSILNLSPSTILGNTTKGHFSITWRFLVSELFTESESQSFNYKKGDYDSISNFIASIDWEFLFLHKTADQMFNILISNYRTACTYFIPKINKTKKKYDLWVTPHIKNLIREKKSAWHINCSTKWENSELKIKYNRLNRSPLEPNIFESVTGLCSDDEELFKNTSTCPIAVENVLNRQYSGYFSLTVMETFKKETASARLHNIDSEELMSMFSNAKDLSNYQLFDLEDVMSDRIIGKKPKHKWYIPKTYKTVLYSGRVEKINKRKNDFIYTISY
ncbi:uncharacterized protein LOC136094153 [Hydra vulgaris]|uniref:uncharacterized protein LOC136094153 n=1 Tax=Hydra vulgaris TaxID=6087 RepID=UPI0032EA663F